MPDVLEEQGSERPDIGRFVGIVRRRHLQFLIPLFLGWLAVWAASWVLPARYKSSTLILVEQPTMTQDYVAPNINDDMQSRLESLKQQILARTRLLLIIDKLHLYSGDDKEATSDGRVQQMRKDIDVELIRDPQKQNISSFRVAYAARSPKLAQAVTKELASVFITENQAVLNEESHGATSFLEERLDDARASLAEQEGKVRQFESQHEGNLPTQQASNLQILVGLQTELQNEQDSVNAARQQRAYLQAMIEQERTAQENARPVTAAAGALAGPTDLVAVDQQLEKMRAQLAELSSRYTDRYPDVQNLKNQIAKTEEIRTALLTNTKRKSGESAATQEEGDPTLGAALRQLQGQLQENQVEIANREQAVAGLEAKIAEYQGRLNLEPETEQRLADLTRGYDQSKAIYDDLLKKKDQSAMATSMEEMQQGERFTVLDPASLPEKPDFPDRGKFCMIGLAVGLALGLIVAGGLEFLDDRMHSDEEIKALLPMAVISEVPEIVSPSDEQQAKRKIALGWAAMAAVTVTIAAGFVFSFLHG